MFRKPDITINISSLTLNTGELDMSTLLELETAEQATLAEIKAAIAGLAVPTVTVDLTPVTDALAAISTKLDSVIAVVGTAPTTQFTSRPLW